MGKGKNMKAKNEPVKADKEQGNKSLHLITSQ